MKIKETKLKGVYKIDIEKFSDFRGEYIESFNLKQFLKFKKIKFIQDDFSISKKMFCVVFMVTPKHGNWFLVCMVNLIFM